MALHTVTTIIARSLGSAVRVGAAGKTAASGAALPLIGTVYRLLQPGGSAAMDTETGAGAANRRLPELLRRVTLGKRFAPA